MNQELPPAAVGTQTELENALATLDRNQLLQLVLALAGEDPAFAGRIMARIERSQVGTSRAQPAAPSPEIVVDLKKIRREVGSALRGGYRYGSSYSSWGMEGGIPNVGQFLDQAWELVRTGRGNLALAVLEAITGEYVDDVDNLADEEGELGDFLEYQLAPVWTEAVLTADLTPNQREDWASKLDTWAVKLGDYGYDDIFTTASTALVEGWTDPVLQDALSGELPNWGALLNQKAALDQKLVAARLNVLEREGRLAEALNLARAAGQSGRYATLMLRLGRVSEAVEAAQQRFTTAGEALAFAQELRDNGHASDALTVGERGLTLEGSKGGLAGWLTDLASELGRADLAILAAVVGFKAQMDLAWYQRVQSLAGPSWSGYREELLAHLRQRPLYLPSGGVDVFLHENLIDDAIAAVDRSGSYDTIERVARAAVATRPDWVVSTCRSQAERIMDSGKAQHYQHAVDWLTIARDAYRQHGQAAEWRAYLNELIVQHTRKYKLRPMLEDLT